MRRGTIVIHTDGSLGIVKHVYAHYVDVEWLLDAGVAKGREFIEESTDPFEDLEEITDVGK